MEEWLRVGNRCRLILHGLRFKSFNPIYVKVYIWGIFVHKSRSSKCSKQTTSLGKPGCNLTQLKQVADLSEVLQLTNAIAYQGPKRLQQNLKGRRAVAFLDWWRDTSSMDIIGEK